MEMKNIHNYLYVKLVQLPTFTDVGEYIFLLPPLGALKSLLLFFLSPPILTYLNNIHITTFYFILPSFLNGGRHQLCDLY